MVIKFIIVTDFERRLSRNPSIHGKYWGVGGKLPSSRPMFKGYLHKLSVIIFCIGGHLKPHHTKLGTNKICE